MPIDLPDNAVATNLQIIKTHYLPGARKGRMPVCSRFYWLFVALLDFPKTLRLKSTLIFFTIILQLWVGGELPDPVGLAQTCWSAISAVSHMYPQAEVGVEL